MTRYLYLSQFEKSNRRTVSHISLLFHPPTLIAILAIRLSQKAAQKKLPD